MVDSVFLINNLEDYIETMKLEKATIQFKNSASIYNAQAIDLPGVKLRIIPDINLFDSTSSIINFLRKVT